MNLSESTKTGLIILFVCLFGILIGMCNRALSQPRFTDTGFFKHVNKQDSSSIYLRFVAVNLPDNETGYVVETFRIAQDKSRCAFMSNDVRWDGKRMVFKSSGDKWILHVQPETATLTVNFPHSTSVFFRTEENPAKFCFQDDRKI